jgi:hypothetical protein
MLELNILVKLSYITYIADILVKLINLNIQ